MPPAGDETLALWHEAGEWWDGKPSRKVHRFIDAKGIRREHIDPLVYGDQPARVGEAPKIRRIKDEKASIAGRGAPEPVLGTRLQASIGALSTIQNIGHAKKSDIAALHLLSGCAVGRGTMIAMEIPAFVAERGYGAALLADPFSLTAAADFDVIAKKVGIQGLIGATFEMAEGGEVVLVARNKIGYRSLSRLITACHLGEPRLFPLCTWERLSAHTEGLLCLTGGDSGLISRFLIRQDEEGAYQNLQRLISLYRKENVFIQIERTYSPWQLAVNRRLLSLAEALKVTPVAGGAILHEQRDHFPAHDVLVCIETLCSIDEVEGRKPRRDATQPQVSLSPRRSLNAERYLREIDELQLLYADRPDLVENTWWVVERCENNVLPEMTELPRFCDNEESLFREIVWAGARARCSRIDRNMKTRLDKEINRVNRLHFTRHFLVAWDMCKWAEEQEIVFSGRGSVVDSFVAYCLGISRISAAEFDLHFDRFLPVDGRKRPDIDIDFEAKYRDDVRQYLVRKYGDQHVATVAAIGTYGTRGIIREVGKVMGIPEDSLGYLAKRLHGSVSPHRLEQAMNDRPELRDSNIPRERFQWVFKLAERLMDLPRNLRSHSSGVVISATPIADIVPMTWSAVDGVKIIQWDKRSAKKCFDKFDILCLRGNDVLGDTQRTMRQRDSTFSVTNLPLDDPNTYRAMRAGELIGIPQSASPAMRQAHTRIQTQNLKDAGIVQAAIRPGVGGAVKVQEYVHRRKGKPYRLIHEQLAKILDRTLGIIVFQEQVDQLLETFGDYSPDDAEIIRESIYKQRRDGYAAAIREEVIQRIVSKGYSQQVADEVFEMVSGFQGYGFAEGHALAFAEISVRSIWCQQNFPAEYFCALMDAQPAGYYGPYTLANEARSRGVKVLPPDVNLSGLGFKVEDVTSSEDPKIQIPNSGMRVSLRQIGAVSEVTRENLLLARESGPFESFFDFVARVEVNRDELEQLILCGAFDSLAPNRRSLLWAIPKAFQHAAMVRTSKSALPLFLEDPLLPAGVEDFSNADKAIHERRILHMDIERHLVAFEREKVRAKGGITSQEASQLAPGTKAFVVGNPIRLRFPPTSSGKRVMFFDLEDETGLLNVTCFDDVYQRDGHQVICQPYITLWGESQDRDGHIAFLAHRIYPYSPALRDEANQPAPIPIATADFLMT